MNPPRKPTSTTVKMIFQELSSGPKTKDELLKSLEVICYDSLSNNLIKLVVTGKISKTNNFYHL